VPNTKTQENDHEKVFVDEADQIFILFITEYLHFEKTLDYCSELNINFCYFLK
jgi:hypothetical protein